MRLQDLYSGMEEILGPELARRYFLRKTNATCESSDFVEDLSSHLAEEIIKMSISASRSALCNPALDVKLRDIYQIDYEMLPTGVLS